MTDREEYAVSCTKHLKEILGVNADSFALIGLLLKEAKKYFKDIPDTCYKNIYEFSKSELALCKTTTKYYLAIHTKFCDGQAVKSEFREYNYSQLREMIKLSDEDLSLVNPSMTCKDIAKLCKELAKKNKESEDEIISDSQGQESPKVTFKNKDERINFLKDYTSWDLFDGISELDLKFYKAKLSDGSYIIATESLQGKSPFGFDFYYIKPMPIVLYSLVNPSDSDSKYDIKGYGGISAIEKYMSANKLSYCKPIKDSLPK